MTGGLRRHPDWTGAHTAIPLLGRLGEPRRETLLGALGRLWEAGLPVEWESLFAQPPTPSSLPPVPLDSEPCPTPQDAFGLTVSRGPVRSPSAVPADVPAHFGPAPSASAAGSGGSASAPPENATLDELWCHALGVSSAQPQDNFYLLGGESLGLIHLLGWIRKSAGVRVPLAELAEQPTFGALTELVSRAERDLLHLAEV
jgi:phthiocerol/phenolphthiocerol synthesis type-I polyketide synthase E